MCEIAWYTADDSSQQNSRDTRHKARPESVALAAAIAIKAYLT